MDLRQLGRTGVEVSPLCLGAMMFGAWGNTDHDDSIRIIHRALDAGINFVDTADVYSQGESEEIVGKALAGRRDEVGERAERLVDVGAGLGAVHLVEVDPLGLQAAERGFDLLHDPAPRVA